MKTLNRYIGREVLLRDAADLRRAARCCSRFFDLIHELGNVGKEGYTLGRALLLRRP